MDRVVLERYADAENAVLCRELGVGLRTLERHAAALGVRKSEEHVRESQAKASREAARWFEYMRITGQKVQKKAVGGKPFAKGHRFEGEIEARRVKSIRDRVWDERRRMMYGLTRRTKWKMVDDFEKKL